MQSADFSSPRPLVTQPDLGLARDNCRESELITADDKVTPQAADCGCVRMSTIPKGTSNEHWKA